MAGLAVEVDYSVEGDLLWLGNGVPNTDSAQNVTFDPDFDAFFSVDGECVGIYLFDAARILMPQLARDLPMVKFQVNDLTGVYFREGDALTIGNGKSTAKSEEVAEGLAAHYDEAGKVAGFTIVRARNLLLPILKKWPASTSVCPSSS